MSSKNGTDNAGETDMGDGSETEVGDGNQNGMGDGNEPGIIGNGSETAMGDESETGMEEGSETGMEEESETYMGEENETGMGEGSETDMGEGSETGMEGGSETGMTTANERSSFFFSASTVREGSLASTSTKLRAKNNSDATAATSPVDIDIAKSQAYASLRSVKDLNAAGYCDPNDPCCMKPDPERLMNKSMLQSKSRKHCAPKNPFHFEYSILHRLKLKKKLQAMVEQQLAGLINEVGSSPTAKSLSAKGTKASSISFSDKSNDKSSAATAVLTTELPPELPPKPVLIKAEALQEFLDGLGLGNLALAHEIALNKDFKFCKPDKPITKSASIFLVATDRYWKKVDQVLIKRSGNNTKEAKNVIMDIVCNLKRMLLETVLPNNPKMRIKVEKTMNIQNISKLVDADSFDFRNLMSFVLESLSSLCCPVRDQEIIELRDMVAEDVPYSRQVKKAMDLMEDMNLDMANFIIRQSRPHVIQNCVTYERNQFALYIEQSYNNGSDPLQMTRSWITRNIAPDRTFSETMAHAFLNLLINDYKEYGFPPETMALDWPRYPKIRLEIERVVMVGAIITSIFEFVTLVAANSSEGATSSFGKLRLINRLRQDLNPLLKCDDIEDHKKLQNALNRCSIKAVQAADHYLVSELCENLTASQKDNISELVKSLADKDHPSRSLYCERVKKWFVHVAKKEGQETLQAPADLQIIGPLILDPITEMIRLVLYNRSVFDVIYKEIFNGNCPPPTFSNKTTDADNLVENNGKSRNLVPPMDQGITNLLQKLHDFNERTMTYRKSRIQPEIQPFYNPDGSVIIPPEQQTMVKTTMTPLEEKHLDELLLATEPTVDADYEGLYDENFTGNDANWLLDQTSEQLIRLMERENIIKANKLKRIKKRMERDMVNKRIANDFPVFDKIWREELGTLQKEFCRLQRIQTKGNPHLPENVQDEPRPKRVFKGACELIKPKTEKEPPKYNEKGERIFYSRNRGDCFSQQTVQASSTTDYNEPDFSRFETDHGDEDGTVIM